MRVEESMREDYIGATKLQCPVVAAPVRVKFCRGHCDRANGRCKVYALKLDLAVAEFDDMIVQSKAAV